MKNCIKFKYLKKYLYYGFIILIFYLIVLFAIVKLNNLITIIMGENKWTNRYVYPF